VNDLTLEAIKRDVLGKKTRFLRRQGITPTHLFGHNVESMALQCDTVQLRKVISRAGMTRPINLIIDGDNQTKSVFVREIQRDGISRELIHVDFYQVKKGERITMDVPIILIGEAPAMKAKGRMLTHGITSLAIECLPDNIPSQIEVDISHLEEAEQAICVRDIILNQEVTVHTDPDQLVIKVSEAQLKAEEEAPAEAKAEAEAPAQETP